MREKLFGISAKNLELFMNTIYFSCERAGKIMARPVYEPKKYYVGGAVG